MRPYHRENLRDLNDGDRYRAYEYVADDGWSREDERTIDPELKGQRATPAPQPPAPERAEASQAREETPAGRPTSLQGRRRLRMRSMLGAMLGSARRLRRRFARLAQRETHSERGSHSGTDASASTPWVHGRERSAETQAETAFTSKS